ncbi:MAG: bifunctional oligoribonuclease/PAP phosphatase NrnA [Crocinitomicaceae bacterium]
MFDLQQLEAVKNLLKNNPRIVITAHKSADGDSVGSSLALMHFLNKSVDNCAICHPDKMPDFFNWLSGSDSILTFDKDTVAVEETLAQADLIFCLDYNHPSRVGNMQTALVNSTAKKIMIDHHQNPSGSDFDILFSFPKISSTCELIYEFITALNQESLIDESIGNAIYCGIMTDTGSFRFPSTTARTHQIISNLIDKGVKNHTIHEQVHDVNTISKIKLNGYAMSEKLTLIDNLPVAYISLTMSEMKEYNAAKGDTEGLVNKALSIKGVKMAIFFKEDSEYVKISFRSKGNTFVNELARDYFEGGGHIYAAGGKFTGTISEAIKKLVTLLPEYVHK